MEIGVQHVLALEYDRFAHELIEMNAQSLRLNASSGNGKYMLDRLTFPPGGFPSIARSCSVPPANPHHEGKTM